MTLRDLIVTVMLIEGLLHYFPWRKMIGRELPRLAAYTLGLLGLMVPFSVWLMDLGEIEIMKTLWIVIGAGGFMVFALYGLDHYLDLEWGKTESEQREQVLVETLRNGGDAQGK